MKRKPKLNLMFYRKKKKQRIAHMKIGSIQTPFVIEISREDKVQIQQQQQQHSLFSQASWGRLEMKPERNKFKVQAH